MITRDLSKLTTSWLTHCASPALRDELTTLLRQFPPSLATLMPKASGWAEHGAVWLDESLVSDPERDARWMLATYLHEVAHAHLQRIGADSSHSERFSKLCWGLQIRFGVQDLSSRAYDMHESRGSLAGWENAADGAIRTAAAADPLAYAHADARRAARFNSCVLIAAFGLCVAALAVTFAIQLGYSPSLSDALGWLIANPIAGYVAGLLSLLAAVAAAFGGSDGR